MLGLNQRVRVARGRPTTGRPVPVDYAEAVEKWAREHGGHAKLKWLPSPMNCWAVILSYKVGDPRAMDQQSEGEPVLLHDYWPASRWEKEAPSRARRHQKTGAIVHGYYAYELDELGVEGIIQRLDRGNMLSGRGEFGTKTPEQVGLGQVEKHKTTQARRLETARDDAGARARDIRRRTYKIPFLRVGISFGRDGTIQRQDNQGSDA